MEENQKQDNNFDDTSMFQKDYNEMPKEFSLAEEDNQNSSDENIETDTESEIEPEKENQTPKEQDDIFEQNENSALKKYIVYISREFVPIIDSMTLDERVAYINDAIQTKIDTDNTKEIKNKKKQLIAHIVLFAFIFILTLPFAFFLVNKAIMLTFENYKYSQENFEKLYKQRFEKDSAYMRSIQYNKKHSIK